MPNVILGSNSRQLGADSDFGPGNGNTDVFPLQGIKDPEAGTILELCGDIDLL